MMVTRVSYKKEKKIKEKKRRKMKKPLSKFRHFYNLETEKLNLFGTSIFILLLSSNITESECESTLSINSEIELRTSHLFREKMTKKNIL